MKKIIIIAIAFLTLSAPSFAINETLQNRYNFTDPNFKFTKLPKLQYKALSKPNKKQYKTYKKANKYYLKALKYKYLKHENRKAIKALNKAIELNPLFINTYIEKADLYISYEYYEEAIETIQKILEINPSLNEYNFKAGLYLSKILRSKESNFYLNKYLSNKPNDPYKAYHRLLKNNLRAKNNDQIIFWANKLIAANYYKDFAHSAKSTAFYNKKHFKTAKNEINRALKINDQNYNYYIQRAFCNEKLNLQQSFLQDLKTAKEICLKNKNSYKAYDLTKLITSINQKNIDSSVKNVKHFIKIPDWYKICPKSYLYSLTTNDNWHKNYWATRRNNFFYEANSCKTRYKNNDLLKCYENINKEQDQLSYKYQKILDEEQQQAYLRQMIYIKSMPQQVNIKHNVYHY